MSKTTKQPSITVGTGKVLANQTPAKLSDRYIVVCPVFFEEEFSKCLTHFNVVSVRETGFVYNNGEEDIWIYNERDFNAVVVFSEHTYEKFVYVKHQGRLYVCEDVIKIAALINEIKSNEAAKIIK